MVSRGLTGHFSFVCGVKKKGLVMLSGKSCAIESKDFVEYYSELWTNRKDYNLSVHFSDVSTELSRRSQPSLTSRFVQVARKGEVERTIGTAYSLKLYPTFAVE